jgi:hypothetical protein
MNFTFLLPCIVTDFFLNNLPDAPINQFFFCCKTLHVSGIFSSHHQHFSTVHSTLVSFMQVFEDRFQTESGWNILTQLGNGLQNLHETYQCQMYSRELLMMGREDARNM